MLATDNHAQLAYEHADKAIGHYQRLLAGDGLTARDKRMFRLLLIKAVFARAAALRLMETELVEA
jgi:hypothetical protein